MPGDSRRHLAFADEMLSCLVEQLQSPSMGNQGCAHSLRQVLDKLQAAKDVFSADDKQAIREFVPVIRTRAARVQTLMESVAAFHYNSLLISPNGPEAYTPDGVAAGAPTSISLNLEA